MRILPSSFSSASRFATLPRLLLSSLSRSMTTNCCYGEHHHRHLQDTRNSSGVIVIMGATGTGKTKLSIDVATRFGSEIINSDKIQVYSGLDITTNKVPVPDRRGVPHHLLGSIDPAAGELSAASFRSLTASAIDSIVSRGKVPVVAGGSNSFINAMVSEPFDPKSDPFSGDGGTRHPHRFRYRCCFIWVDVERAVLREYLDRRVDEMVGSGMVEELEGYFRNTGGAEWERNVGLNKAIGVPEFRGYFGKEGRAFAEAVEEIKENTWRLAEEQVRKIRRLGECGWALRRVDATGTVRERLAGGGAHRSEEIIRWERDVAGPAFGAVEKFLMQEKDRRLIMQHQPHPHLQSAAASSSPSSSGFCC